MNDMYSMVKAFPKLLTETTIEQEVQDSCIRLRDEAFRGLCIIGMGGSSIAGLYVQTLLQESASIPIVNIRDAVLPSHIQKDWIVIAVSYSGNTEETIKAHKEALRRNCKSFIITSGGQLQSKKDFSGKVVLPQSFQPRAAFPLIFTTLLNLIEILLRKKLTDFNIIANALSERVSKWEASEFSPKALAQDLLEYIPVFIGSQHLTPVAYRAKCQVNENAKAMAFSSELPEAYHNEIESFDSNNEHSVIPVFLRSSHEINPMKQRFDILMEIYEEEGYAPIKLSMKNDSKIEEVLMLTYYLDLVSIELAGLRGVNPVSVDKISKLKSRFC